MSLAVNVFICYTNALEVARVASLEPLRPACALNGNHSGFSSNLKK